MSSGIMRPPQGTGEGLGHRGGLCEGPELLRREVATVPKLRRLFVLFTQG